MNGLIKRGDWWHLDTFVKGKPVRGSLRTKDKKEAEKRAKKLLDAAFTDALVKPTKKNGVTLGEAFKLLYAEHWSETKDRQGVLGRFATLTRFIPEETPLTEIDQDRVDGLVLLMKNATYAKALDKDGKPKPGAKQYPYARATINRVQRLLGYILNRMVERGKLSQSPRQHLGKENRRKVIFTREQEGAFYAALVKSSNPNHGRCLRLFQFLSDTGCRLGEAFKLTWESINFERRYVILEDTKSGEDAGKPLTTRALNILSLEHREGYGRPFEGIGETMYRNAWNYGLKAIGLADSGLVRHSLRHTAVTRLVVAGVDFKRVQQFVGHKSINTTLGYSHLRNNELDQCVDVLENVGTLCVEPTSEVKKAG